MLRSKENVLERLELRLGYHLEQFEKIKNQVESAGLGDSSEWKGASQLIRTRVEEIHFNMRYYKLHRSSDLRYMILSHVSGLLSDLEYIVREQSKKYCDLEGSSLCHVPSKQRFAIKF